MAIASGLHDTVVVAGVEAMTHTDGPTTTAGLATASHWATEGGQGETFVSLNAALMQAYMDKYGTKHAAFAPYAVTAHNNANRSTHAVFHKKTLTNQQFESAATLSGKT